MTFTRLLPALLGVGGLTYVFIKLLKADKSNRPSLPFPPGPKGKAVIGNLLDLPSKEQWLKITEWAHEYGEIVHASVAGQHLIYLNTYEVAFDLLERRSSKYSDRVVTEMLKLMEGDKAFSGLPYGEKWRLHRRIFHQEFNAKAANKFLEAQLKHTHKMLSLLLQHPDSFANHVKHFASSIIIESVYGIHIKPQNDPFVRTVELAMTAVEGIISGAYLVDTLPLLKHIPAWIPGATFKKKTNLWKQYINDCTNLPFEETNKRVVNESDSPSMVSTWIHKITSLPDKSERDRLTEAVKYTAVAALFGGFETTSTTLSTFILLMALNPDIQEKAHQELDDYIGRSRLPNFSDRENLPYINAILMEVLRFFPIIPLVVPHRVTVEDEYKGMKIPKGSLCIANTWAMTRDQAVYGSDADAFRPDRFLEGDLRDPRKIVFGFGRRICPGRYTGENSLFIAMSSILHSFRISKAVDKDGNDIPIDIHWVSGITVHPEPFMCSIKPRFSGVETVVLRAEMSTRSSSDSL